MKKILLLFLILCSVGCQKKEEEKPIAKKEVSYYAYEKDIELSSIEQGIDSYNETNSYKLLLVSYDSKDSIKEYNLYDSKDVDSINYTYYDPVASMTIKMINEEDKVLIKSLEYHMQCNNHDDPHTKDAIEIINYLNNLIRSIYGDLSEEDIAKIKDELNIPTAGEYIKIKTNEDKFVSGSIITSGLNKKNKLTLQYLEKDNKLILEYEND